MVVAGLAGVWLVLVGCDDTEFPSSGGGDDVTETGYAGVQQVAAGSCLTGCHEAAVATAGLDLETDLCAATVGVTGGCGEVLVAAGDSAGSLLWQKIDGSQGCGGLMPPAGQLDQSLIDLVAEWIDSGAACE